MTLSDDEIEELYGEDIWEYMDLGTYDAVKQGDPP